MGGSTCFYRLEYSGCKRAVVQERKELLGLMCGSSDVESMEYWIKRYVSMHDRDLGLTFSICFLKTGAGNVSVESMGRWMKSRVINARSRSWLNKN